MAKKVHRNGSSYSISLQSLSSPFRYHMHRPGTRVGAAQYSRSISRSTSVPQVSPLQTCKVITSINLGDARSHLTLPIAGRWILSYPVLSQNIIPRCIRVAIATQIAGLQSCARKTRRDRIDSRHCCTTCLEAGLAPSCSKYSNSSASKLCHLAGRRTAREPEEQRAAGNRIGGLPVPLASRLTGTQRSTGVYLMCGGSIANCWGVGVKGVTKPQGCCNGEGDAECRPAEWLAATIEGRAADGSRPSTHIC